MDDEHLMGVYCGVLQGGFNETIARGKQKDNTPLVKGLDWGENTPRTIKLGDRGAAPSDGIRLSFCLCCACSTSRL